MRDGEAAGSLGREALAYADALYNLARYLTGNDTDAEDLVQETYTRALRAASQFTPGTNLKAWLLRILRNTFISQYRRRRNDPTVGGLDTVAPEIQPSADIGWRRDEVELDRALMTLSDDARTAILLDLEGLSESEAALVMGCAVGTIKSRLSRARATLRATLKTWRA